MGFQLGLKHTKITLLGWKTNTFEGCQILLSGSVYICIYIYIYIYILLKFSLCLGFEVYIYIYVCMYIFVN